ncbi:MAG: fibronectin type III domain-containing protein, partial [Patescibacteria group bacterium]
TYPNGGETWYKGNSYTITWQNPLASEFTGKEKYYWNVLLKRGNTAWQADGTVPVTQSSYVWSKWTGWPEPIPNATDFKVGISLVDTCAAQVGGSCPSANISITPSGGVDYSDGYFMATSTPPATTSAGTAPTISNVQTTDITSNTAVIIWNTDRPTDTQVEYGLNNLYGSRTTLNTSMVASHSVNLTGLNPATTYYYRVKSKDASGYYATMNDYTFTTASPGTPPSTPTGVYLYPLAGYSSADLRWNPSTDDVGVVGYKVYENGIFIVDTAGAANLTEVRNVRTGFSYTVAAYDALGNISPQSSPSITITATTNCFVKVNGSTIKSVTATDRNDCYNQTSFGSQNCSIYDSYLQSG